MENLWGKVIIDGNQENLFILCHSIDQGLCTWTTSFGYLKMMSKIDDIFVNIKMGVNKMIIYTNNYFRCWIQFCKELSSIRVGKNNSNKSLWPFIMLFEIWNY